MKKLFYIHDPMCSWCWGFNRTWSEVEEALHGKLEIEYVVGGLAQDSDQPMPEDMQMMLQSTWRAIQQKIPGTRFNFEFWSKCKPRRSTYPACRAVLAAKQQNAEKEMILAIQHGYYMQARNPSDNHTLELLARELGLDAALFSKDLNSTEIQTQLIKQIEFGLSIGAQGFPSLILRTGKDVKRVQIDYNSSDEIIQQLEI